jgi:hypothetical protein
MQSVAANIYSRFEIQVRVIIAKKVTGKLIKHYAMKVYGGVDV